MYLSKELLDKDFIGTLIYITEQQSSNSNLDLLIKKRTPRVVFKIKKYYIIYIWNERNMDFDISEIAAKNILVYEIFNKKNWDQEAKIYGYQYIDQISKKWKEEI